MKKLTGMLLLLAWFNTAWAAEYWEACNGCSDSQKAQVAKRAVPADDVGRYYVYVMDFARANVQKYRVLLLDSPFDGRFRAAAARVPTESRIAFEFSETVRAIKEAVATLQSGTPIPGDVAGSAYDVVHNEVLLRRVADHVNAHLTIWQAIGLPVSVPLTALGKIVDLNIVIPVTFSDGSTANLVLKGLEGRLTSLTYKFELQPASARDADGNLIPATAREAAPYVGVFSSPANAQRLVDFVQGWYTPEDRGITCHVDDDYRGITVVCRGR